MIFSLIVPTFNRAASLDRLLASLAQSRGLETILTEVIVDNNGSTDRTGTFCAAMVASPAGFEFRFAEELKMGTASALNCRLASSLRFRGESCPESILMNNRPIRSDCADTTFR